MDPGIAGRFPLMCRPRPLGLPLQERITAVTESALDPAGASHHEQVARASGVINIASLIASDVGLRELAWDMCFRHYGIFTAATHLDAKTAIMALQPLINIPRLLIRDGEGQRAYEVLEDLNRAARARSAAEIAGQDIDVSAIIRDDESHRAICAELWADLLSDGTRALAQAGRWTQAAEAVAAHKGVGERLWDGRQVTILSLLDRGRADEAAEMVDKTRISDASEKAVAALLRTFCAVEGKGGPTGIDVALGEAQALIALDEPPTIFFRTQSALTALALASAADASGRTVVRLRNAVRAAARTDAYAARAVLATLDDDEDLRRTVDAAGLARGGIAPELMNQLTASVTQAEGRLAALLEPA